MVNECFRIVCCNFVEANLNTYYIETIVENSYTYSLGTRVTEYDMLSFQWNGLLPPFKNNDKADKALVFSSIGHIARQSRYRFACVYLTYQTPILRILLSNIECTFILKA